MKHVIFNVSAAPENWAHDTRARELVPNLAAGKTFFKATMTDVPRANLKIEIARSVRNAFHLALSPLSAGPPGKLVF